jgi:uracil-DNA glycosylase
LCRLLGFISNDSQDLSSPITHITNAVKCDVSCETGQTGRIAVSSSQAETCIANFLIRELDAVNSKALVFFGKNAQKYVLNEDIPLWTISNKVVGNRMYKVMRVPHTSPESFNTYGEKGEAYVQPFKELLAAINIGG